jgi:hypothetical protein
MTTSHIQPLRISALLPEGLRTALHTVFDFRAKCVLVRVQSFALLRKNFALHRD